MDIVFCVIIWVDKIVIKRMFFFFRFFLVELLYYEFFFSYDKGKVILIEE